MAQAYIKVFLDFAEAIEPLGDAERGRLFTAMLYYAKTGEAPQLYGNERFIFPAAKAQIDRDNQAYAKVSAARSSAGAKGGLAKASKSKQNVANASKTWQLLQDKEKDKDKDKDKDKEKEISPYGDTKKRFSAPSVEEVELYCRERGNGVDAQRFVDYYSARGWVIGKIPMKDWKAAVRTWERREKAEPSADKNAWMDDFV